MNEPADLIIVGGGMAGGLLAALLASEPVFADRRILILDAGPEPRFPRGEPATRVSSLTAASQNMLDYVGVWSLLPEERIQPFTSMDVWDADGTGRVVFHAHQVQRPQLGWLVENDLVVAGLYQRCHQIDQVEWRCNAPVSDVRFDSQRQQWSLVMPNGETLETKMLAGADGARSLVRTAAGIPATPADSGHRAIVATVYTELPHGGCARQRFIDTGPLALLPIFTQAGTAAESCVSIVWSLTVDAVEPLMKMSDADFGVALMRASEACLGKVTGVGKRFAFPIHELHASSYYKTGLALLGDAAHVVHPLAGQGINLGMLDAGVLAEEMIRGIERGLPAFDETVLARYERRRRGHNLLMQRSFRGFKKLFEQPDPLVRFVRNSGMRFVNQVGPVKNFFTRQALGSEGDLPRSARDS